MSVTFWMPHGTPLTGSFDGLYVSEHELAVYTTTYATYLGIALIDQTVLWWSFSRRAPRFFQLGLRLLAVGSTLGIGYALSTIGIVVQRLVNGSAQTAGVRGVCRSPFSSASCTVAVGAPALVIMVVAIGVLACIISARFDNLARWTQAARSYQRLGPLWHALTTAHPELATATSEWLQALAEDQTQLWGQYAAALLSEHGDQLPPLPLHDPLAAAVLIDPTVATLEHRTVAVSTSNDDLRGQLHAARNGDPNAATVEVATAVDHSRFLSSLLDSLVPVGRDS